MFATGEQCPGESKCRKFQTADPETTILVEGQPVKIGRLAACKMCDALPTKPENGAERFDRMVDRVENLIAERDAGFPLDRSRLSRLEAEGVIAWTRIFKACERAEREMLLAALMSARHPE